MVMTTQKRPPIPMMRMTSMVGREIDHLEALMTPMIAIGVESIEECMTVTQKMMKRRLPVATTKNTKQSTEFCREASIKTSCRD